jgi:CYTH domain-containing protein
LSRYAHPEREQRWLLDTVPRDAADPVDIYDRYLVGTRLRLRQAGDVYKLGQKIPTAPDAVALTNVYLSRDEYEVFLVLPARELRKRRRFVTWHDHRIAVDEFTDRDLVLAEVELVADEPYLPLPPWAVKDVTGDVAFTGGALAR